MSTAAIYACGTRGCVLETNDELLVDTSTASALSNQQYTTMDTTTTSNDLDKRSIMVPIDRSDHLQQAKPPPVSNYGSSGNSNKGLRGTTEHLHFCEGERQHDYDSPYHYLTKYSCGRLPNHVNLCHYTGINFQTMCVRHNSAIFKNLHPQDYCGPCQDADSLSIDAIVGMDRGRTREKNISHDTEDPDQFYFGVETLVEEDLN